MLHVHVQLQRCVQPELTARVLETAAMFGLGIDREQTLEILPDATVTLRPGEIVFVTGESGGGKSSLLRRFRAAARLAEPPVPVVDLQTLDPAPPDGDCDPADPAELAGPDASADSDEPADSDELAESAELAASDRGDPAGAPREADAVREARRASDGAALVDQWPQVSLQRSLARLSVAGLSDAFVLLRRPGELSDGQRARLRLARAIGRVESALEADPPPPMLLVLADEFGATLDRTTAAVLARNVRRWVDRQPGVCFVAATTHDDLLEPLSPDMLIVKGLGAELAVARAGGEPESRRAGDGRQGGTVSG